MVTKNKKPQLNKEAALRARLALDPDLPEKIDRALADYEEARARGELRRKTTPRGNGGTGKRTS